ncbi:hypothetical protein ACROYT_G028506 [Oculina patagonica]
MKELRTPQRNSDEPTSFNAVQQLTDADGVEPVENEDGEWRLDSSRYSKWYRVKPKGQLEFGLSFVRDRGWVQRFIENCRRPENQRDFGELTPIELRRAENEIVKETQNKTFAEEINALKSNKPQDTNKVDRNTTWYWNPPQGPHFESVFESMIKSAKRAIYAVLKDADISDEELETTFIGVESLMNLMSDDPNDEPVLTPNHFLIGQMGDNLKVGNVVMVIELNTSRRDWKVERIERTYPGRDQLVRVVDVRVGDKILNRPVTRISPFEFADSD